MLVCAAFSGGAGASDAGALLEAARRGDTAQVASLLERPGVAGIDPDYVRERRSNTGFAVEIAVPAMPFPDSEGTKSAGE
ncbi:hypothetical protein LDZ36_29130, partial [Pseudomonas aeruginosa]|nr:hypothetical protein [Pseudomonas aeruginosa]